jgi:predicted phage baseplate assembly protein
MPGKPPEIVLQDFTQISADLKLLIPRYLPEWTDHNESDPGITLLELFAYLADAYAYRLNQVPDALYDKLLALLAIYPDPARPSTVQLHFTTAPASAADPILVPRQTVVSATGTDGRPVYFETDEDAALTRYPLVSVQVFDGTPHQVTTDFDPLGASPAPGNALYLGFGPADPGVPDSLAPFPSEIRLHVVPLPLGAAVRADAAGSAPLPTPPVRVQWEYLVDWPANRWQRLQVMGDASVAFTREGDVRVAGPPLGVRAFADVGAEKQALYWLRCRLLSGAYPDDAVPRLTAIEANSIGATAWRSVPGELLGTSSGRPDLTVHLANVSVDAETFVLEVTTGSSAPAVWRRKDDLFASGPRDPDFVLDVATGAITFGDGSRGLIPPASSELRATYRYGGGARGNVTKGSATGLQGLVPGVTGVTNARDGVGGSDAQTTEHLRERAASRLRARNRAVTVKDLTETALQVPGVARAQAVPLAHPELPGVRVPGAVTVVVVPRANDVRDRMPRPTPELLDAVARRLDEGRAATAEVWVTGPVYRVVRVRARIQVAPFASPDAVRIRVQETLHAFLSPVAVTVGTGVAEPTSIPRDFGADLYPTSLYKAILDVSNVESVPVLNVWVDEVSVELTASVSLAPNELVASAERHELIVVPTADAWGGAR